MRVHHPPLSRQMAGPPICRRECPRSLGFLRPSVSFYTGDLQRKLTHRGPPLTRRKEAFPSWLLLAKPSQAVYAADHGRELLKASSLMLATAIPDRNEKIQRTVSQWS